MAQPVRVPRRVQKVAQEIARLPIELHDSILRLLRFTDIVYLSFAAAAFPSLLISVQHGPSWRWLMEDSLEDIQDIWNILNDLSWLLSGQSWIVSYHENEGLPPLSNLKITSAEFKAIFSRIEHQEPYTALDLSPGKVMVLHLQKVLLARLCVSFGSPPPLDYSTTVRNVAAITWADRRGIVMFIPENVREAIIDRCILPENWNRTEPWQECLNKAPNEEAISQCAEALPNYFSSTKDALRMAPLIRHSLECLRAAQSSELSRMKELYDAHPTFLKKPLAPQSPRKNQVHILKALERDAKHALTRRFCLWHCDEPRRASDTGWYRFRSQLPVLVPYDWCMSLFDFAVKKFGDSSEMIESPYVDNIRPHLQTAFNGLPYIYEHPASSNESRRHRIVSYAPGNVCYRLEHGRISGCPRPVAEMEWLESFLVCVEWMVDAFPEDAKRLQQQFERTVLCRNFKAGNMVLSGTEFTQLARGAAPEELAQWLYLDSKICDQLAQGVKGTLPSLLAFYMPPYHSAIAKKVARHMVPGQGDSTPALQQLLYEQTVEKIVGYLSRAPLDVEDGDYDPSTLLKQLGLEPAVNKREMRMDSDIEWQDALKAYESARNAKQKKQEDCKPRPRLCYICRFTIDVPHPKFTAMCIPCGEFNLTGSRLTLGNPERCWNYFEDETALVTGGRVNLGFHIALELLRHGMKVIITTRYPQDALRRFQGETDHHRWFSRLSILGADFRCSADVFEVVRLVKKIVEEGKHATGWGREPGLKLLINNAAQTLTDAVSKEQQAVEREVKLLEEKGESWSSHSTILDESNYRPRVRGGMQSQMEGLASAAAIENSTPATGEAVAEVAGPSSWAQSLNEIPYDDVISAHSVNTFTPLILIRELGPLIGGKAGRGRTRHPSYAHTPIGHIINVSSREGIFEAHRDSRAKNGKHVHTNMSKAGLNMITETEAARFWKKQLVAMNTVDPGYMSAAPEYEDAFGGERPLGWEDGAARVLWPIHRMEKAYRSGKGEEAEKLLG